MWALSKPALVTIFLSASASDRIGDMLDGVCVHSSHVFNVSNLLDFSLCTDTLVDINTYGFWPLSFMYLMTCLSVSSLLDNIALSSSCYMVFVWPLLQRPLCYMYLNDAEGAVVVLGRLRLIRNLVVVCSIFNIIYSGTKKNVRLHRLF